MAELGFHLGRQLQSLAQASSEATPADTLIEHSVTGAEEMPA